MQPRSGVPTSSARRTHAARAAATCQQLITRVEDVMLARTSCSIFVLDVQPIAEQLTQLLSMAGCELDDRLTWFRDCLLPSGDYAASRPGERLFYGFGVGVPVFVDDDMNFHLHNALTPEWLRLMRGFAETLCEVTEVKTHQSRSRGKGGRPKSEDVLRSERDVERLYQNESQRLRKEGMDPETVVARLKGMTKSDVLEQLQSSPTWMHTGISNGAMLKRIGRTPAWRTLHSPLSVASVTGQEVSSDAEGTCPQRDNSWAWMNQLNVRSGTRTKPNSGVASKVLSSQG